MGSIVEVLHAFPYAMIGANTHQAPSHRSAPLRPSHPEHSSSSLRSSPAVDTPMTDVLAQPPRSLGPVLTQPTSHSATIGMVPIMTGSEPSLRPPPSPRLMHTSSDNSPALSQSQPTLQRAFVTSAASSNQNSPRHSAQSPPSAPSPQRIKVKSLSHIQSFVIDDANPLSPSRTSSRLETSGGRDISPQYEISDMPVADIIEMVAGLLTKITTTNDRQHEYLHRQIPPADAAGGLSQQTTSVLAFHGKNVPSISILSYLSRIHKYCPTTYEVFLSLLVYFDRMTERVNAGPMQSLRQANEQSLGRQKAAAEEASLLSMSTTTLVTEPELSVHSSQAETPPPSGSLGETSQNVNTTRHGEPPSPPLPMDASLESDSAQLPHFFVVDSFNIHRLVIAGVTCASKFFSDIFYTNSRYAKVRHSILG
jgi:PHO85 cyclin-6/7